MISKCVVCGSAECGLVRDPMRDNDYICAGCLFAERKILKAEVERLKTENAKLQADAKIGTSVKKYDLIGRCLDQLEKLMPRSLLVDDLRKAMRDTR